MGVLHEATRRLLSSLGRPDFVASVLEQAGHAFRADAVRLALLPRRGAAGFVHAYGSQKGPADALVEELTDLALRRSAPLRGPEGEEGPLQVARAEGYGSLLVFPLILHESKLGSLSLWRRTGQVPFSSIDLERGAVIAAEVAMALENAALHQQLEATADELRLARDRLVRTEKLAATGRLAAGIAHEINTPTQFVADSVCFLGQSFSELLALVGAYRKLREATAWGPADGAVIEQLARAEKAADLEYLTEQIPKAIERALEGISRMTNIARAMKEFTHPGRREKSPSDLNRALESTLMVAHNELKYVADVERDFGDLPPVTCVLADINQVFLNLLVNAAHAIGETGRRGKVTVRTRTDGNDVVIEVADTGCGIPEESRKKIFDPFFTTKELGRGTGQGLAIARSTVVDGHGGSITFDTVPGKGTTFRVRLPIEARSVPEEESR